MFMALNVNVFPHIFAPEKQNSYSLANGQVNCYFFCEVIAIPSSWLFSEIKKRKHLTNGQWHPTPVLLPGKSHGEEPGRLQSIGSLESDMTERLHFHFSLSCIGEGNGNPLQCSCLENPRDGDAWWAAVYGVAQSRTRLKRLSSSSSSIL